jgi:hypothetical protein
MFPRLREQIGTALDLFVEFSTLGEYRLVAEAIPGASSAPADAPGQAPQLGGVGVTALRAAVRRTVAGGATGSTPVATPAARRLMQGRTAPGPSPATPAAAPQHAASTARAAAPQRTASAARAAAPQRTASTARCAGNRSRVSDTPPARRATRVRKGTPQLTEQLCLAV